jgi:hypothetical protein
VLKILVVMMLSMAATVEAAEEQPTFDPASPKAALLAEIKAARAGDVAAVQAIIYAANDEDKLALGALAEVAVARARYEQAMNDRFGKDAAGKFAVSSSSAIEQITAADESIHEDHADVTVKNGAETTQIVLIKIHGSWKVPASVIIKRIENTPPHVLGGRYIDVAAAFDDTVAGIKAGEYPTADDAAGAASTKVDDAANGKNAQ